jgi:hypothetical protein
MEQMHVFSVACIPTALQIMGMDGRCTLGRTNLTVISANPSPGLFIDMQTPASCSGEVMEWNVCYFNPRDFNTDETLRDGLEIGLQVWRFSSPENGVMVGEYVVRIDIPQVTESFQCIRIPVPSTNYISVEEGDVMGVVVPFNAVLPVVGNFLSASVSPPRLSQFIQLDLMVVNRQPDLILTNNVLHVTAEIGKLRD